MGHDVPTEALWLARSLWEQWPPRRSPRPLRLVRRPAATDAQWDGVRVKLETACARLAEDGVTVQVTWGDRLAIVTVVDTSARQLNLLEDAA